MNVVIEGQDELLRNLDKFRQKVVSKDAIDGLKEAGMMMVAEAQETLRRERNNTTGRLSQSGKVQVNKSGGYVEAGFMRGEDNYATYLEYGTRAHWVSIKWLLPWVKKKMFTGRGAGVSAAAFAGKSKAELAESTAYAIRKSIAREGTKPHPFFVPAVKKHEKDVVNAISRAIERTTDGI